MSEPRRARAWAEIDLDALGHNASLLAKLAAPSMLCAVVKADGYGHGAPAVSNAVLSGGASWLAVAITEEGASLREAAIRAPILLLAEPPAEELADVVSMDLVPTMYTRRGVRALAEAAERAKRVVDVHVKIDTGMHRVGADPIDVAEVAGAVVASPWLRLQGLCTHLAVAEGQDQEDRDFTGLQLRRFSEVCAGLAAAGIEAPIRHAANSAATILHPASRLDMVRCGISLYGSPPDPSLETVGLRPVLSLRSRVSMARELQEGERPSYGRQRPLGDRSVVATVPIGYADGVPRRYFTGGGSVLIGGRRCPLAGMVTMDQIVVDCGDTSSVNVGDEVTLIGRQGSEEITAWEWAAVLGTISYEVFTSIGPRVARISLQSGSSALPAPSRA